MKLSTRKLVLLALFIALSFVGAQIKIFGSIAFDSLPAFLGTFLLGPIYGTVIAIIGHLLTAITSGFPLSIPVHLLVSLAMGIAMIATWYAFNFFKKRTNETLALVFSVIIASIFNGPIAQLICSPLLAPILTWPGVIGMMLPLALVGGLNAAIAGVIYKALPLPLKSLGSLDSK